MGYEKDMVFFNEEWNTETPTNERMVELATKEIINVCNHKSQSNWDMSIKKARIEGITKCVCGSKKE